VGRGFYIRFFRVIAALISFIGIIYWVYTYDFGNGYKFIDPIYNKLTLSGTSSVSTRLERWGTAIKDISSSPFFGHGIGYYSSLGVGSSISWYLFVAAESGILSLFCFIGYLFCVFLRILFSKSNIKYPVLIGFIAASSQFAVITTIQHPPLWALIALFSVIEFNERSGTTV
ncbi:MAG: hypothetical protein PF495_00550, partial [Spirochaetales bacterium]|nr:hypothetical protein [Spirochaetales bacterium]